MRDVPEPVLDSRPGGRFLPLRAAAVLLAAALLAACGGSNVRPSDAGGAGRVEIPTRETIGARLAERAAAFVGTRYRYGGATPDGFDCSGLVWYVHRELGIAVPRRAADQRAAAESVPRDRLLPGDLVFFYTPEDHVGIYLGGGEFVHAPASGRRVSRARLDSPYFAVAFAGAGRFAR